MKKWTRRLKRFTKILMWLSLFFLIAFLIYFPGSQTPIAFTLATGIGVDGLQSRVDQMEDKAIGGEEFTEEDKRFLENLYTCFAKGGRLTYVLRQTSQMMRRYLSCSGEDLQTSPRIFVNSRPVQYRMASLKDKITQDVRTSGKVIDVYASGSFYMGDPEFLESQTGLHFGELFAYPKLSADEKLTIRWRAECPWEWPSYESQYRKHGNRSHWCFPLPNPRSVLFGRKYDLRIDDGLGGHLTELGLAKPFLVWSEWEDE